MQIPANQNNNLKECRELFNLSQEELAKKVGVSIELIDDWERGVRTPPQRIGMKFVEIFNAQKNIFKSKTTHSHTIKSSTFEFLMDNSYLAINNALKEACCLLSEAYPDRTPSEFYMYLIQDAVERKAKNDNPGMYNYTIN